MQNVKLKKEDLIEKLKGNRSKHREIFESAQEGYRTEAIELLEEQLHNARKGKQINTYIQLEAPVDQTKDYDRVISMLEMSVDSEITLTESDFAQYVLDDWSWKHQFLSTNAMYTDMV